MTNRLPILLGTMLLVAVNGAARAADEQDRYAVKSFGTQPCSEMLTALDEKRVESLVRFGAYLDGYVTAANAMAGETFDIAPWQDTEVLLFFVGGICADKPDAPVGAALQQMLELLFPQRLTTHSGTVELGEGANRQIVYKEVLRRAQRELIDRGKLTGTADGAYGPKTKAAIEAFQQAEKLPTSGVPDRQTLFALFVRQGEGPPGIPGGTSP